MEITKKARKVDLWDFIRSNNHLVTLVTLMIIATIVTKGIFIKPSNLSSIILRASILGTIAIGQTLVILTAGIDLCVAANVGFTVAMMSLSLRMGIGPLLTMAIGITAPTVVGFLNGQLVARTMVPPFIVTLATSMIIWSTNLAAVGAHATVFYEIQEYINNIMSFIPIVGAQAFPAIVWIFFSIFWILILRYSTFGHNVYATGGKEKAAFFSGVKVKRVKILVYTFSGLFAGIGSLLYCYKLGGTNPVAGKEFLLESIAATVIGGTSLYGGEGKMFGTFIGSLVMIILVNFMNIANVNPFIQQSIIGGIFIGFVYALDRVRTLRLMKLYQKE